jgi:hypothetical protein
MKMKISKRLISKQTIPFNYRWISEGITSHWIFLVNRILCSKKLRINLNVPLQFIEQKESDDVHRTINEDRKMIIQAVIIRIMKARQTLKYNSLMQEVIQQLQSRFKPEIPTIKVNELFNRIQSNLCLFYRNVLIC